MGQIMPEISLEQLRRKTIVFRFCGGKHDGSVIRSDVEQSESYAKHFWNLTWEGTVGRRFDITDPQCTNFERYQVKRKVERDGEIVVTCEVVY